ncbi:fatty acid desaturase [Bdellovibrio sp. HCB337]|uniref:fatty acid desaturase n=1 Tax=Bdellovibrio sp. HCB337 TaxID=3394358 RepID=UPI0039A66776
MGLLFGALRLHLNQFSVPTYIAAWGFGVWVVFLVSLLNHNHHHHPTFHSGILNRVTDILISICIGAPSTRLHLVHHFNHHRHYQSEKDWSNYRIHAKSKGVLRILYYLFSASREMAKNRRNIPAPLSLQKHQVTERIVLGSFSLVALWLNPGIFLGLIVPTWVGGLCLLLTSNLFNHDQCDLESEYNHSRNFLGKVENWFFLNNGFHSAHHEKPELHWSLLPELHERTFEHHTNENLKQSSFLVYFARYIFKNEI